MSQRLALVIGIDKYPRFGRESQLAGAINDARAMAEALVEACGFSPDGVDRLLGPQATRRAILDALERLSQRVRSEDQVVVFFSGHGSQMTDREGDEGDGLDETLVPVDSGRTKAENRDISDDEINHWAAGVLAVTSHLTLIFDCCHSATLHRPDWRVKSVPPDLRPIESLPPAPVPMQRDVEIGPRPLIIAACRDEERAFEAPASTVGEARGLLSFHLIKTMRSSTAGVTWREIFDRTRSAMGSMRDDQHPQISGDGLDRPLFAGKHSTARGLDPSARLLRLAARPDPFGLTLKLFRSRGGAWRRLKQARYQEGDRLRVDVNHQHPHRLYIYLLDIGLTGRITLLFPDDNGVEALDPHTTLTIGARSGDSMDLCFPADAPEDLRQGEGHLVLIGVEARIATSHLAARTVEDTTPSGAVSEQYRLLRR